MKQKIFHFREAAAWFLVSALVIVLDQFSKYLVMNYLYVEQPVTLLPFFNLILRYNQGAAFSFLGQAGGWQVLFLSLISIVVIIILLIWLLRLTYPNSWIACGISLVIGGAAGNLIDRLRFSVVIDFFDFHVSNWHYATFNVADSAIVVGVIMLLLHTVFYHKKV
ncbi:MAG: lipoprotein signal peptidase [Proteobacteria bacterium]|nr:lipoprotein signal peptidase [Pseudomonadota bacterium]